MASLQISMIVSHKICILYIQHYDLSAVSCLHLLCIQLEVNITDPFNIADTLQIDGVGVRVTGFSDPTLLVGLPENVRHQCFSLLWKILFFLLNVQETQWAMSFSTMMSNCDNNCNAWRFNKNTGGYSGMWPFSCVDECWFSGWMLKSFRFWMPNFNY